eukprot:CAMPEP_0182437910 /NCGR_PEP_ID=MMETSP1167-20130531/85365_1 /TAXON_ID=2988 /ORGANISM="Mallomonas Sp, Strain CCMP3275" /LENGTH=364 /DNA_ID=CAMNT_0024630993 /DNA_START=731 /DNA_END=1822 /DNA_ORIENTATION=-
MKFKRITATSLHALQSIPGLIDTWRLITAVIGSILGSADSLGLGTNSTDKQILPAIYLSSSSLSLFLTWLHQHRELHALIIVDRVGWTALEQLLNRYLNAIGTVRKLLTEPSSDPFVCLSEDRDLIGFLPLCQSAVYDPDRPDVSDLGDNSPEKWDRLDRRALAVRLDRIRSLTSDLMSCDVRMGSEKEGIAFDATSRLAVPDFSGPEETSSPQSETSNRVRIFNLPGWSPNAGRVSRPKMKLTDKVAVLTGFENHNKGPKMLSERAMIQMMGERERETEREREREKEIIEVDQEIVEEEREREKEKEESEDAHEEREEEEKEKERDREREREKNVIQVSSRIGIVTKEPILDEGEDERERERE